MNFNASPAFTKVINSKRNAIQSVTSDLKALNNDEEYAAAAFRGGDTTFDNEEQLKRYYAEQRNARRAGRGESVKQIKNELNEAIAKTLTIDADELSKFAAMATLPGMTDADLRRLAEKNPNGYSVLVAISSNEKSKFSRSLKYALDEYRAELDAAVVSLTRFISNATWGESNALNNWESWCESRIKRVDEAYEKLQAFIRGEVNPDLVSSFGEMWEAHYGTR